MHGFEYMKYHKGASKTGQCFYTNAPAFTALTTLAQAVDKLIAFPFVISEPITIDKLEFEVTGAGGAGCLARVGIYSNEGSGILFPQDLICQSAEFDATGTGLGGGAALTPNAETQLDAGVYWGAYSNGVGTVCTVRAVAAAAVWPLLGWAEAAPPTLRSGIITDRTYVSGSLPSTFPDPGTNPAFIATAVPVIMIRPKL